MLNLKGYIQLMNTKPIVCLSGLFLIVPLLDLKAHPLLNGLGNEDLVQKHRP